MKRLNFDTRINRYSRYALLAHGELGHIGHEIQKYIDWNDNVSVEDVPGDGLCLSDGEIGLVPLNIVIEIIKEKGVLSEHDYNSNKI